MPIGGIGGIGGRAALFEHVDGARTGNQPLFGATFGGHPLSLVAGAAQLKLLTPEVYRYLDVLGDRARGARPPPGPLPHHSRGGAGLVIGRLCGNPRYGRFPRQLRPASRGKSANNPA
jgi:hypothetical protein